MTWDWVDFLSFLVATAAAQTINFYVQKNFVFRSNAAFTRAVPRYICLAVVLVIVSAALPAYSQAFFKNLGLPQALVPTLANGVNIVGTGSAQLSGNEVLDHAGKNCLTRIVSN